MKTAAVIELAGHELTAELAAKLAESAKRLADKIARVVPEIRPLGEHADYLEIEPGGDEPMNLIEWSNTSGRPAYVHEGRAIWLDLYAVASIQGLAHWLREEFPAALMRFKETGDHDQLDPALEETYWVDADNLRECVGYDNAPDVAELGDDEIDDYLEYSLNELHSQGIYRSDSMKNLLSELTAWRDELRENEAEAA